MDLQNTIQFGKGSQDPCNQALLNDNNGFRILLQSLGFGSAPVETRARHCGVCNCKSTMQLQCTRYRSQRTRTQCGRFLEISTHEVVSAKVGGRGGFICDQDGR